MLRQARAAGGGAARTQKRFLEQTSMCFSATASFVTAGVTAAVGIASLSRVTEPRELPLAATPILFALQQSIEGLLWLTLPLAPSGSISTVLTLLFLLFAQVLWPVYVPIAVLLVEPNDRRRRVMYLCLAVGIGVGGYFLWSIFTRSHGAVILDGHIVYATEPGYPEASAIALAYFAATGLPLMLSSQRTVVALGAIVLVGSAVAYLFYWEAFVSVWCFFAAAASIVILCQFEWSRRLRLRIAGP